MTYTAEVPLTSSKVSRGRDRDGKRSSGVNIAVMEARRRSVAANREKAPRGCGSSVSKWPTETRPTGYERTLFYRSKPWEHSLLRMTLRLSYHTSGSKPSPQVSRPLYMFEMMSVALCRLTCTYLPFFCRPFHNTCLFHYDGESCIGV